MICKVTTIIKILTKVNLIFIVCSL